MSGASDIKKKTKNKEKKKKRRGCEAPVTAFNEQFNGNLGWQFREQPVKGASISYAQ
jgi:hypothetical protein